MLAVVVEKICRPGNVFVGTPTSGESRRVRCEFYRPSALVVAAAPRGCRPGSSLEPLSVIVGASAACVRTGLQGGPDGRGQAVDDLVRGECGHGRKPQ